MQFKTLLVASTLALSQTAMAAYNVANCGKAAASSDASSTKAACNQVGAEVCDRTGLTRCIVDEGKFGDFKQACKKEGVDSVYKNPGSHDHFTATRLAGCL